jgi:hypothetical protein
MYTSPPGRAESVSVPASARPRRWGRASWVGVLLLGSLSVSVVAACGEDAPEPAPLVAEETATVTFQRDIRPLLETHCASCHVEGGAAPMALGWRAEEWGTPTSPNASGAPSWAELAVAAVASGKMPPWMPSPTEPGGGGCEPLKGDRRLSEAERALFAGWAAEGYAKGKEVDYVPPVALPTPLTSPSLSLQPVDAYVPNRERPDDYHCFLLPQDFEADTFVVATSVEPGVRAMAHHALLFQIPPEQLGSIEALDDAEPGEGYTCFGGPGGSVSKTLGAWVPGSVPTVTPEGSAMVVSKGSRLVLQMHYNTVSLPTDEPAPADRSSVALWTMAPGTAPQQRVESLPFAHLGISIEAGDPASKQQRVFTIPADGELVAIAPHMHRLGTEIRVSLLGPGGPQCLVEIPRWDFNWQQQYGLVEPLTVKRGDKIQLDCTYDNSKEHQPVVNGVRQDPRKVTWGEGTSDEMCLTYVSLMQPYERPPVVCGDVKTCQAACAPGDGGCFFDCTTESGGQCGSCLVPALAQCALPAGCASPGLQLQSCLKECGDPISCLRNECAEGFDAFYACMQPYLESGQCNEKLAPCNIVY